MAEEIVNRVANSKLMTFDLEDFYPKGERILFDIKDWLLEGLVLREKEFRAHVVGDAESGHKLVLIINDGAARCIVDQSFVLDYGAYSPAVGDHVAGGHAEADVLETGVRMITLQS